MTGYQPETYSVPIAVRRRESGELVFDATFFEPVDRVIHTLPVSREGVLELKLLRSIARLRPWRTRRIPDLEVYDSVSGVITGVDVSGSAEDVATFLAILKAVYVDRRWFMAHAFTSDRVGKLTHRLRARGNAVSSTALLELWLQDLAGDPTADTRTKEFAMIVAETEKRRRPLAYKIDISWPQDHRPDYGEKHFQTIVDQAVPGALRDGHHWSRKIDRDGKPTIEDRYVLKFERAEEFEQAVANLLAADLFFVAVVPNPEFDAYLAKYEAESIAGKLCLGGYKPATE